MSLLQRGVCINMRHLSRTYSDDTFGFIWISFERLSDCNSVGAATCDRKRMTELRACISRIYVPYRSLVVEESWS